MMGYHLRRTAGAVILIISLFITGLAVAGPNEDAEKAFEKAFESGDDTTLRALAEEGNTRAQASLGFWHIMIYLSDPDHNPVDNTEGVKWIRKSAEQGDAFGQYILGLMYIDLPEEEDFLAKVLPHDNTEAMKWIRKAAEQGDRDSQSALGEIFYDQKNYPETAKWWQKAADQGDSDAMYKLGVLYENGQGVQKDFILAHMWLNLAVMRSSGNAEEEMDRVASKMTPAQIAEAQKLAKEWKPKPER